eukprot:TRINITY_DN112060_c0_g1_i1.p1 TRINITY_DN112060_c0_g1~~TRINITY_DN112060_c0_g1_i1.p1  ORF type:complete len:325 (+),score=50.32 TRINITY_DN112060_c0_g1_i1:109-975(+)
MASTTSRPCAGPGRRRPWILAIQLCFWLASADISDEEAEMYRLYDHLPQLVGASLEEQAHLPATSAEAQWQREVEARVAAANATRNITWWEGELTGMLRRKILALNDAKVVLCFTQKDGGGCRAAVLAQENSSSPDEASSPEPVHTEATEEPTSPMEDTGLLPTVPWGETALFSLPSGGTSRLEMERLDDARFVACFQRAVDSVVACSVGLVDNNGLQPFASALELGPGHLVSISIAAAGRRFSVCAQPLVQDNERGSAQCRWAQVAGGTAVTPKWTKDKSISPMKNY